MSGDFPRRVDADQNRSLAADIELMLQRESARLNSEVTDHE